MKRRTLGRTLGSATAGSLLVGCAIPASRVYVPTESMHEALQQARGALRSEPTNEAPPQHSPRSPAPPGAPHPSVAPPEVRMAYLYEWVDSEGNKHFGDWVAIPLGGFDWVMDNGANSKMTPSGVTATEPPPSR
jgi:hypothetical protein